ncbi:MAG TPA: NUDIX domain-containing protein [Candidatus Onthovicinus excrementipullorum]|nr:NUDIX domain-containing protein [Candidatus Onthovicinus excrementipullorum]
MDCTFRTPEGRFNYRATAVIISRGNLLVMRDEFCTHYYLPGGRIRLHETARDAVRRELWEELNIEASVVRPLWLNENFFTLDPSGERVHEMGIYFLTDVSECALPGPENLPFSMDEDGRSNTFFWLPFGELKSVELYPLFIRERIFTLPEQLEMITEIEP